MAFSLFIFAVKIPDSAAQIPKPAPAPAAALAFLDSGTCLACLQVAKTDAVASAAINQLDSSLADCHSLTIDFAANASSDRYLEASTCSHSPKTAVRMPGLALARPLVASAAIGPYPSRRCLCFDSARFLDLVFPPLVVFPWLMLVDFKFLFNLII